MNRTKGAAALSLSRIVTAARLVQDLSVFAGSKPMNEPDCYHYCPLEGLMMAAEMTVASSLSQSDMHWSCMKASGQATAS